MSGPFTKPEGVEELHIAIEAPEGFYKLKNNDVILATLIEALGSHVISVLRKYPERTAEYLRNWHTECRIYHDRCVVTRRGEVIAEGVF